MPEDSGKRAEFLARSCGPGEEKTQRQGQGTEGSKGAKGGGGEPRIARMTRIGIEVDAAKNCGLGWAANRRKRKLTA